MHTRKPFRFLGDGQRGITGLETAIILIAFVVVASVFAYTVLTAGVFSSQKSNESVNAAIDEVRSALTLRGTTLAFKGAIDLDGIATTTTDTQDAVAKVAVTVGIALNGVPLDVTPPFQVNVTNGSLETSGLTNSLVLNYLDQTQLIQDMAWTVAFTGADDGDFALEATERAVITMWLVDYSYDPTVGLYYRMGSGLGDPFIDDKDDLLLNFNAFSLELSPIQGAPIFIEKVIPQGLSQIMNLR